MSHNILYLECLIFSIRIVLDSNKSRFRMNLEWIQILAYTIQMITVCLVFRLRLNTRQYLKYRGDPNTGHIVFKTKIINYQSISLSARAEVASLWVGTLLWADSRWSTFIQILAVCGIVSSQHFTGWTCAQWSDRCLDAAVGTGSSIATICVALC